MNVPLLDLKAQYETIKTEILAATQEVFDSQHFILGPKVQALEEALAGYCRTSSAVGVSSGTDALLIALMAADVGPNDLVLTTPYTFFATVGAIARVGARALFADIDRQTYNIDPRQLEAVIAELPSDQREHLKAVIPVHLYGQCADMEPILALAQRYQLTVIEDAAQAIGAEYKGQRAGAMGAMGCFSFFPSKNLGAFGDGGMVTTTSQQLDERLRVLRVHGAKPKYYHHVVGGNFRLDALQAAVVSVKLKYLDAWTAGRQANARRYQNLFEAAGLTDSIQPPAENTNRHIYNQYVIRVPRDRDQLRTHLQSAGIGTEVYYPVPMHLQQCFADLRYQRGDFSEAEQAADQTLALPIYPELSQAQQEYVVEQIRVFYQ